MGAQHAYTLGRADYSDGKTLSDNRFKVASPLYREWERGWTDAVLDDLSLTESERRQKIGDE